MRTYIKELIVVVPILCMTTFIFTNNLINWITTSAVIATFCYAQIADRMQEKQSHLEKPTVECYYKLNWFFVIKEILWVVAFILMKGYSGIVGCVLFSLYPLWRKYYRKHIKPMDNE